jgi:uncharacterized protein (TIGR02145 family)
MADALNTAEALFYAGKMNKDLDERFIKPGEYIDALNIRIGSSELGASSNSDLGSAGAIENSKGNTLLTNLQYISSDARCIGAYEDSSNETIYWFVTSNDADLVLSYNTNNSTVFYHLISLSLNPILKFDKEYLINGINKIDDLLFWTDNLNPPRRINVKSSYTTFDESDISVIVAPPMSAPEVSLFNVLGEENYILDKFISFSYRYRYLDGEYSALSQFSDVAFEPGQFELDYSRFVNIGMTNSFNSVKVEFNTGPKQVVGIDICFKLSDSNIVNVIEKFDKKKEEWSNNKSRSLVFTNRKIYTTLTESELLRLYDNVPRIARAQTSIGNRIMYGNYVDGYDVGQVDYSLEVISANSENNLLPVTYTTGSAYTIDPGSTKSVPKSVLNIDLTDYPLKKDYVLSIEFNIINESSSGDINFNTSTSPAPNNDFIFSFSFLLEQDYDSVLQMATSQEFIDAISTHELYADASKGISLTDFFNLDKIAKPADAVTGYGQWYDIDSGIFSTNGAFLIIAYPGSNVIGLQCPAVKFTTEFPAGTTLYAYQYYNYSITDVFFNKLGAKRSLHSNRDYEVAIVYMDNYLRSSTALVDTENTVFIDPQYSDYTNNIRVNMISKAPSWATKYKFVLKQSVSSYQIVYTNLFFIDDLGNTWFKLDGDNRQKVSENQTLIVKRDTNGAVKNLVNTTVLELVSQPANFIAGNEDSNSQPISEPSGLYMRLRPSGFSAEYNPNSFKDNGSSSSEDRVSYYFDELNPSYISGTETPTNRKYIPYAIPAGSQITFNISMGRGGTGGKCQDFGYTFSKNYVSSKDYPDMFSWFIGDRVNVTTGEFRGAGEANPKQEQENEFRTWTNGTTGDYGNGTSYYFWQAENAAQGDTFITGGQGRLKFTATTGIPCCRCGGINPKRSFVDIHVTVQTGSGALIFETKPEQDNNEIYFENSQSFDIIDGYHMSGNGEYDQNQTPTQDAIIDLDFFNCFSFGNGAESYKINDSITGVPFYLGSRVTAVSQEDFKEAQRYAGITYSGIYNSETNLNKLNEFNLALVNWKDCEKSFGPINVMHGRKTDVLVLQEDKVSNVLVGKNLLSDAAGGGAITATPEVLGTQIARIEEYGISGNPESFVVYGYNSYFTDTKRNVVLNLKGDDLIPISSYGMNNWFRNQFKGRFGSQNIGGYDPYMKEYVLTLSDNKLPSEPVLYNCGTTISQENISTPLFFNVEIGNLIGDVVLDYNFSSGESGIVVRYNGSIVIDHTMTGSGFYSFYKSLIEPSVIEVEMSPVGATYSLLVNCAASEEITVVRVVLNSVDDIDKTIHNRYNWTFGSHTSLTNTDFVIMESDTVSLYDTDTEMASFGPIPAFGSTVKMSSNKLTGDTFVFDNNNFKYLVSDTLYSEGEVDLLKYELDVASPVFNPSTGNYEASFDYINPNREKYLYLVWDYMISTEIDLCYNELYFTQACIDCYTGSIPSVITTSLSSITSTTATSGGTILSNGGLNITDKGVVWSTSPNPTTSLSTKTNDGTGSDHFSSYITGLTSSVTYYVRAYATNAIGTAYGNELTFTSAVPELATVKICDQTWTLRNLEVTTYRNGNTIPQSTTQADWIEKAENRIGAWCYYNYDTANGPIYGKLYNAYAVNDTAHGGLAPLGYHVPTDAEWTQLTDCLGGESVAGGKMKSTGTALWTSPNTGATNSSGFTGLPGGSVSQFGGSSVIGAYGFWWSSSEYNEFQNFQHYLQFDSDNATSWRGNKGSGISVRLIKDL